MGTKDAIEMMIYCYFTDFEKAFDPADTVEQINIEVMKKVGIVGEIEEY